MAELTDARREAFCQGLARGLKKTVAYRQAGYSGDRGNASRAAATPEVLQRVEEIRASLPVVIEPPEVEIRLPQKGEKVDRESMTRDIDLRILKAEAAGEWPTVAALTATRAKLHGLLLQEQAAAEGGAQLSDNALLAKIMEGFRSTGAGIQAWQVMRLMGMRAPDGKVAGPGSPVTNGHGKEA